MKLCIALAWPCVVAVFGVIAAHGSDIESVQKSAIEWARVRAETTRLKSDWQWQRQLMVSTNAALADRVRKLETQRDDLKAKTSGDRTDLDEMAQKNSAAAQSIAQAEAHLKTVTAKLVEMRPMLPPRLSQAVELPYRSLANPALSPGERMLYVTTILNRCEQFNKAISYGDEAVTLPGEADRKLLNVIYWGLGAGYALDLVTGKAYVGRPGTTAWTWQENDGAAKALTTVIAINQEKADPNFVELPVQLARPAATTTR